MLSNEFLKQMEDMLGDEYPLYLSTLDNKEYRGFRINTLKIKEDAFLKLFPYSTTKSPYAKNGYYLNDDVPIGKSLFYACGLLYMQEPSASAAVTVLDVKPGMKVLDLCAAPGSKSTEILEQLNGEGLLVANEYSQNRAQILKENIERSGAYNAIITTGDTKDVADRFPEYFDAVLCDAPCSGEGMFRKEEKAIDNWSMNNVLACVKRQKYILDNAYKTLKPGGVLVYSTCTFNKHENEYQIEEFIKEHPDMHIEKPNASFGRSAYATSINTEDALRIFPMDKGEGHFICRMRKEDDPSFHESKESYLKGQEIPKCAKEFFDEMLDKQYPYYFCYKNKVYGGIYPFIDTGKTQLVRHQVYLGEDVHGRFEPSHNLFMSNYTRLKNVIDLSDEEALSFIKGETITKNTEKGYYLITWNGYSLGYGKSDGKIIKNKYPKAYRI